LGLSFVCAVPLGVSPADFAFGFGFGFGFDSVSFVLVEPLALPRLSSCATAASVATKEPGTFLFPFSGDEDGDEVSFADREP
jgi:hypothetical protein